MLSSMCHSLCSHERLQHLALPGYGSQEAGPGHHQPEYQHQGSDGGRVDILLHIASQSKLKSFINYDL